MRRGRAATVALLCLLTACTALPPAPGAPAGATLPGPAPEPASEPGPVAAAGSSEAPRSPSQTLLAESRAARDAGAYAAAAAALERALRIAPADSSLWVELAELRLLEGESAQAAALAQKALTLADRDARVTRRAEAVLAAATR